ncbi:hypothetical protein QTJ16_006616 [Diplocarpon rosae]|uniref:DUF8004 domain-containing protein n=1 Tax=Diplocarpon rosae TaxID=946125 RepID=A0AAD9SV31_9HELO|nr:hypothetical protein QTJ16_006616 [Diplocarpon rosae]
MATLQKPQSRLNRLSQFLPGILTGNDAKLSKDQPPMAQVQPPIPRKPISPVGDQERQQSPRRAAPATPPAHESQRPATAHKLQKTAPLDAGPHHESLAPHGTEVRKPRASSLLSPHHDGEKRRSASTPLTGRRGSTNLSSSDNEGKQSKRKSWLPGTGKSRSRHLSRELDQEASRAWVLAGGHQIDYDTDSLLAGQKIPELWDESPEANMFVYLHPRSTGRGPQIKCHSLTVQCSQPLLDIIYDNSTSSATEGGRSQPRSGDGRGGLSTTELAHRDVLAGAAGLGLENPSGSESEESIRSFADAPRDLHLYYPVNLSSTGPRWSDADMQKLVDARNLFAFFNAQPLVSTSTSPSIFTIFLGISAALQKLDFYNQDGTSFGEVADASFAFYFSEMRLADVRLSRAKTVEALVLGERMRYPPLYNEAFAHAVGRFDSITSLNLPAFKELSPATQLQLQQSSRDLARTQDTIKIRLTDFEFPSMFSGLGSSTSSDESKFIRFKNWKANFMSMRRFVLNFYKDRYGQWPPKANSKKNSFHEGGLNRLVLKLLYADLCALYDLLVDKTAFTTRGVQASEDRDGGTPVAAALRKILAEYDRSSPPVQPPIPFDTPLIATMAALDARFSQKSPKEQHKIANRRLATNELGLLVEKSHNQTGVDSKNQFLDAFRRFEMKEGKGKSSNELQEQRFGHWIFLYAVIQSLPMLVTDAPGLQFTEGVEYFLCQIPANSKPWVEDGTRMNWYNVAGGSGLVQLPAHMVEYGVEAVYSRSHCWELADRVLSADLAEAASTADPRDDFTGSLMAPLQPPPTFGDDEPGPRDRDRASSAGQLAPPDSRRSSRQDQRRSMVLGLERLPLSEDPESRPVSRGSPSLNHGPAPSRSGSPAPGRRPASRTGAAAMEGGSTFDDILGPMPGHEKKKRAKKGFF